MQLLSFYVFRDNHLMFLFSVFTTSRNEVLFWHHFSGKIFMYYYDALLNNLYTN